MLENLNHSQWAAIWGFAFAGLVEVSKVSGHILVTREVRLHVTHQDRHGRVVPVRGARVIVNDERVVIVDERGVGRVRVRKHEAVTVRVYDGDEPLLVENADPGVWKYARSFAITECELEIVVQPLADHPSLPTS